jgi:hypothetical protein
MVDASRQEIEGERVSRLASREHQWVKQNTSSAEAEGGQGISQEASHPGVWLTWS